LYELRAASPRRRQIGTVAADICEDLSIKVQPLSLLAMIASVINNKLLNRPEIRQGIRIRHAKSFEPDHSSRMAICCRTAASSSTSPGATRSELLEQL
jgi:hypothetical protein